MQIIATLLSLVLLLISMPLASGTAIVDSHELSMRDFAQANNYTMDVLHFNGTIAGIPFSSTGSIQEVYAKFREEHPEITDAQMANHLAESSANPAAVLNKRNKAGPPLCTPVANWGWNPAFVPVIANQLSYLNGAGVCGVKARSCVRISCAYSAGISLCNDNDWYIQPNCGYLGSYAQDIIDHCKYWWPTNNPPNWLMAGGQEFDTDRYNVILKAENC